MILSSSAVIVASLSGVQVGVLSEREREIEMGVWKGKGKRQGLVQRKQTFLWMFLQCWALGTAPFPLSHHLTIILPLSTAHAEHQSPSPQHCLRTKALLHLGSAKPGSALGLWLPGLRVGPQRKAEVRLWPGS